MKYIALIYGAPGSTPDFGDADFDNYMGAYQQATETYIKDGVMVSGEALEPVSAATVVRVRKGKTETMDGPFAETKEQLGGFYLLDCDNLDDAIRYAAMIPDAATGTIELRPIMNLDM